MRRQILAPVTAGVLLALAGTAAQAAQKTTQFQVSANVVENCTISAGNLAFGDFFGDNDLTANATITVRCTNGTDYVVNLNGGSTTGNVLDRELSNGGPVNINYNLYTDAAFANVWGNGGGGTSNLGGIGAGMGTPQALIVRGRLLASNNVGEIDAGLYTDTVTATVVY
jgi:spore coat protein U-like protein